LLEQALADLAASGMPPGSRSIAELTGDVRAYPIRFARPAVGSPTVRQPRHAIIYRIEPARLLVIRVLHDRQLIARNLDPAEG